MPDLEDGTEPASRRSTKDKPASEGGGEAEQRTRLGVAVSRRQVVTSTVAVVVLSLAIAAGVVWWKARSLREDDERRAAAVTAAAAASQAILSYSSATVAAEIDDEQDLLTGDFADEYARLVRDTIAPAAERARVSTEAEVVGQGVASDKGEDVVVLLFVNVTTTSPKLKQPRVTGSRIEVVMREVDGDWLIADLQPI